MNNILISIIIPYYNVFSYTEKLMKVLEPQLSSDIEVIIVDDGCDEKRLGNFKGTIIHLNKNSGGASVPRNIGLDIAKGKYIAFIDADDLVTADYINTLRELAKENYDYYLFSWKSRSYDVVIKDEPPKWNTCVWNCLYKRKLIGNERFNPELRIGEDLEFNLRVRKGTHKACEKIIYFYNIDTPNSLMKTM